MSDLGSALLKQLDADDIRELARMMLAECDATSIAATSAGLEGEMLTVTECALRAKCHSETIKREIRRQKLRAVARVGRSYRIARADFEEWLMSKGSEVNTPRRPRTPCIRTQQRPMRDELVRLGRM